MSKISRVEAQPVSIKVEDLSPSSYKTQKNRSKQQVITELDNPLFESKFSSVSESLSNQIDSTLKGERDTSLTQVVTDPSPSPHDVPPEDNPISTIPFRRNRGQESRTKQNKSQTQEPGFVPVLTSASSRVNHTLEVEETPIIEARTFWFGMMIAGLMTYNTVTVPIKEGTFYHRGGTDEQMAGKPGHESLNLRVSKWMSKK